MKPGLILTALLLASVAQAGGRPFSWSLFVRSDPSRVGPLRTITDELDIPDGMTWRVEYVSGTGQTLFDNQPPLVQLKHSDASHPFGPQTLTLDPMGTYEQDPNVLWTFASDITAYYGDQVTAAPLFTHDMEANLSVIGTLTPTLAGDFNGDGTLNAIDYARWRDESPAYWDEADYASWSGGYTGNAGPLATAVPEPVAVSLVGLAVGFPLVTRRR